MSPPQDKKHDHGDRHDNQGGEHHDDATNKFLQELHHDLNSGNSHDFLQHLREHHMDIKKFDEHLREQFGTLTLEDKHHHKLDLKEHLVVHPDGSVTIGEGNCHVTKDGKIVFKDGVTIDEQGVVRNADGRVQTDVSNPTAAATEAATGTGHSTSQTENTVANYTHVTTGVADKVASGNIDSATITSTQASVHQAMLDFAKDGKTPPAGLQLALDNLNAAQSALALKNQKPTNGKGDSTTGDQQVAA